MCVYYYNTRIKETNDKYIKTINELIKTGKAKYMMDGDRIIFFNWDVYYKELLRNFAIVW